MKKRSTSLITKEMQIKMTLFHPSKNDYCQKDQNKNKKSHWWECKLVLLLKKTVRRFLKNQTNKNKPLELELLYDPAI
jgi:hypothetical protein